MELNKLKVSELRAKAEELGLSNYSKLKKVDLLRIVTKALEKAPKEKEEEKQVERFVNKRIFDERSHSYRIIKIKIK